MRCLCVRKNLTIAQPRSLFAEVVRILGGSRGLEARKQHLSLVLCVLRLTVETNADIHPPTGLMPNSFYPSAQCAQPGVDAANTKGLARSVCRHATEATECWVYRWVASRHGEGGDRMWRITPTRGRPTTDRDHRNTDSSWQHRRKWELEVRGGQEADSSILPTSTGLSEEQARSMHADA